MPGGNEFWYWQHQRNLKHAAAAALLMWELARHHYAYAYGSMRVSYSGSVCGRVAVQACTEDSSTLASAARDARQLVLPQCEAVTNAAASTSAACVWLPSRIISKLSIRYCTCTIKQIARE